MLCYSVLLFLFLSFKKKFNAFFFFFCACFLKSTTDSELLKINIEVKKTNKDIETIIENFEKRRLKDIKNLFMSFIQIHIKQHAKAIEILSAAYQDIMNIDEKSDFQV